MRVIMVVHENNQGAQIGHAACKRVAQEDE